MVAGNQLESHTQWGRARPNTKPPESILGCCAAICPNCFPIFQIEILGVPCHQAHLSFHKISIRRVLPTNVFRTQRLGFTIIVLSPRLVSQQHPSSDSAPAPTGLVITGVNVWLGYKAQ